MNATQFIAKSEEYWGPYPARSAAMVQEYLASLKGGWNLEDLFEDLQCNLHFNEGPPSIASIMDVISVAAQNELAEHRITKNEYPGTEDLMPSLEDDLEINASDRVTAGEAIGDGSAKTSKKSFGTAPGNKEVLEK